jgi:hypothetical protein
MGAIILLTPIVIGSWPVIAAAVSGAAAAMGLATAHTVKEGIQEGIKERQPQVEKAEVPLTDKAIAGQMQKDIVLQKGSVEIRVTRDARGQCSISATGAGKSQAQLKQIAEEFAGKVTQTFVYNKVMNELRAKGMKIANEEVTEDKSVRIHVRNEVD